MYSLAIILGVICLVVWLVLLFVRPKSSSLYSQIGAAMGSVDTSTDLNQEKSSSNQIVSRGDAMNLPIEYDEEKAIKKKLVELARQPNNESILAHYVNGLIQRHKISINIRVLKKWIEAAGVQTELINQIIEGKEAEGRLIRVEDEEELKAIELEARKVEAEAKRAEAEVKKAVTATNVQKTIQNKQEITDLKAEVEKEELRKRLRGLKTDPESPKEELVPDSAEIYEQAEVRAEKALKIFRDRALGYEAEGELAWEKELRQNYPEQAEEKIAEYKQRKVDLISELIAEARGKRKGA